MANKKRAKEVEELVTQIREIKKEEKMLEGSLFNTERSDSAISALLKETIEKKDKALTQLMSLYLHLAKNIAKGYTRRTNGIGLSYEELYSVGAEAMVLEITRQRWLSLDKALTPLLRQTINGAIKQRIREERERNRVELPLSTVNKRKLARAEYAASNNEPTDEEIADKKTVLYQQLSEAYDPLLKTAAGAFIMLNNQKGQKTVPKTNQVLKSLPLRKLSISPL